MRTLMTPEKLQARMGKFAITRRNQINILRKRVDAMASYLASVRLLRGSSHICSLDMPKDWLDERDAVLFSFRALGESEEAQAAAHALSTSTGGL